MKCKYCGKNVRSIAHFMQAHKALMLRKMKRGRGKRGAHVVTKAGKREKIVHTTTGGHDKLKLVFYD